MKQDRREQDAPPRKGFFEWKDPWGQGAALWVVALLLFMAPVAVISLRHVQLDNDVENWLPDHDPSALEYGWCRDLFPEEEKLVVTWDGSALDDPRLPILIDLLQGRVEEDGVRRGGLPYVSSAIHAGDLIAVMTDHGVDRNEAIRRLQGTVVGRGWLKVRLSEAGLDQRDQTLATIVEQSAEQLGLQLTIHEPQQPWRPSSRIAERFATLAERHPVPESVAPTLQPIAPFDHHLQISWPGMSGDLARQNEFVRWAQGLTDDTGAPLVEECRTASGSPVAVLVSLSAAGEAEKPKALEAIRGAAAAAFLPADELLLGGRVVSAVELNAGVIRAAWNPAAKSPLLRSVIGLSGLVGIIFALISLKSVRLGMLVIGVSYFAALLGMAVVPLTGGSMNMVLVVMPTLLMVLSLSGAIHVANYWKHAAAEDPLTAVQRATRMAAQPCLLAAFTTALGLISLAGSQLSPVRDFGVYSAIGSFISVGMVLLGLPSLLQMMPLRRMRSEQVGPRIWRTFGGWLCRRWLPLSACCLLASAACGWGLTKFRVETKVIRYFPQDSQIVRDSQKIEDALAGICPVEIIVRFSAEAREQHRFLERMEIVRRIEENIRQHPEVSGTISLADFQPQRPAPRANSSARERIFYNRRSHETEKRIREGQEAGAEGLYALTSSAPATDPGGRVGTDELWRINAQCNNLTDVDYDNLTGELAACATAVTGDLTGVDHFVTGTIPLFLRTQKAVLESLIWSFAMAFCLIAIVMVLVLRDAVAGVISMIPNILPVVSTFGLVSWFGQRIDIGTMVTASVALGIAVDGTLHLLTWFQEGLRKGLSRAEAVTAALAHCGPAMWQTSAAVGLGLLVLLPADLLLISRFGWLMSALIGAALIGDIVLLPCLLVGPLGQLIEHRIRRSQRVIDEAEAVADVARDAIPIPAPHLNRARVGERRDRALP